MPGEPAKRAAAARTETSSAAIRFQRPTFPSSEAIERYLELARGERWFSNFGPCAELLKQRLTEATGRPCVVVSNATLGLMLAVAALRRRAPRGAREALVPSFAFAATAQAASWNGLSPVFVDVDPAHWHLDPDALEHALEKRRGRVAVVIALSTFGVPPPPDVRERWEDACSQARVPLLVDSAAGYGAHAIDGVAVGGQGDAEVVSFHATKPLAAGEGGAVFCRDDETAEEVASLANFSFDKRHRALRQDGLNAKMSELTAAAALAALDELPSTLERRRSRAEQILRLLPDGFERQAGCALGTWQFVPVTAPNAHVRAAVLDEGVQRSIGLRTYYDPLHTMPAFRRCASASSLDVTNDLADRMVSLPMAVDLEPEEIAAIEGMVRAGARSALEADRLS